MLAQNNNLDSNSKMIATKYRYLDPSMVGVLDLNVSSNSDIGMSGSFVPWVKLYDGFFFTPEHQPCQNRYEFERRLQEEDGFKRFTMPIDSFEKYIEALNNGEKFRDLLKPEPILIVEKTQEELDRKTRRQQEELARLAENMEVNGDGQEIQRFQPRRRGRPPKHRPLS